LFVNTSIIESQPTICFVAIRFKVTQLLQITVAVSGWPACISCVGGTSAYG